MQRNPTDNADSTKLSVHQNPTYTHLQPAARSFVVRTSVRRLLRTQVRTTNRLGRE
ncbi:hypothetical protein [Microcoleus sp. PH2017_22_RUC_O_B]|uniref:hypothetical protein n=1 Tax=Microcoleus sp. PH2017_22_RUC_O_B TaxID=2798833 RepID=UPI0025E90AD4|nr:hypothetical protein [Microcoleus sp. PH2017_22_RUC_O_B]